VCKARTGSWPCATATTPDSRWWPRVPELAPWLRLYPRRSRTRQRGRAGCRASVEELGERRAGLASCDLDRRVWTFSSAGRVAWWSGLLVRTRDELFVGRAALSSAGHRHRLRTWTGIAAAGARGRSPPTPGSWCCTASSSVAPVALGLTSDLSSSSGCASPNAVRRRAVVAAYSSRRHSIASNIVHEHGRVPNRPSRAPATNCSPYQ
jgi:hypothetical protein